MGPSASHDLAIPQFGHNIKQASQPDAVPESLAKVILVIVIEHIRRFRGFTLCDQRWGVVVGVGGLCAAALSCAHWLIGN